MKNILVYSGMHVSRKRIRFGVVASVESLPFAKFCDEDELAATMEEARQHGGEAVAIMLDRYDATMLARIICLGRMAEHGIEVIEESDDEQEQAA